METSVAVDSENKVTITFQLTSGSISKSGKSTILFTTSGFMKVPGREGESVSINYIKQ